MQVKSIAECSKGSILQYFRPSSSYHLSLRSLFCIFLTGRLRHQNCFFSELERNMYKTYLTCGAILVMMSLYRTADGLRWRDGQKWRQRRIAHVFGKRNQERNMAHVFGKRNEDGISSILQLPIEAVHSAPGPVLNDDSVDYDDGSFLTETEDRVPQSILNR